MWPLEIEGARSLKKKQEKDNGQREQGTCTKKEGTCSKLSHATPNTANLPEKWREGGGEHMAELGIEPPSVLSIYEITNSFVEW